MSSLLIKAGAEVENGGRRLIIMQVGGFDVIVARGVETDDLVRLAFVDLQPVSPIPTLATAQPDLPELDGRDWAEARKRRAQASSHQIHEAQKH